MGLLALCACTKQPDTLRAQFLQDQALAEKGDAQAAYDLGLHYHQGHGVEQDHAEAVKWYRKAAEAGLADAQLELGNAYDEGRGIAQDHAEAFKWFRKAAGQGHTIAQGNLAASYYAGEGVGQDYLEAYVWWSLAAATDEDAARKRAILEKKMTPQQIADAQKRTAERRASLEAETKPK